MGAKVPCLITKLEPNRTLHLHAGSAVVGPTPLSAGRPFSLFASFYDRMLCSPIAEIVSGGLERKSIMSVYKVIHLVGTSEQSWEDAARVAVERASESLRELRIAEVVEQDIVITNGKVEAYRTKVRLSFKYEGHG